MPKLNFNVPHALKAEEAIARVKAHLPKIFDELGIKAADLKTEWGAKDVAATIATMVGKVKTNLTFKPSMVVFDVDLPFLAGAFKGKIEEEVRKRLRSVLK